MQVNIEAESSMKRAWRTETEHANLAMFRGGGSKSKLQLRNQVQAGLNSYKYAAVVGSDLTDIQPALRRRINDALQMK